MERKCYTCGRHLVDSSWVVGFTERGPTVPVVILSRREFDQQSHYAKPAFEFREACRLKCVADLIKVIRSGEPLNV